MSVAARPRRGTAREALIAALAARGGPGTDVTRTTSQCWASITFEGARHQIELRLAGRAQADAFEQDLAESEFALRGHLLADIRVSSRRAEGESVVLEVEALTIEES
jgi:hypothetical protein